LVHALSARHRGSLRWPTLRSHPIVYPAGLPRPLATEGLSLWPVPDCPLDRAVAEPRQGLRPGRRALFEVRTGFAPQRAILGHWRGGADREVRRIQIILAGNADQREKGIAPCVGEGGSHPVRGCRFAHRANRPVGGRPLPGGMDQGGGQPDEARSVSCWMGFAVSTALRSCVGARVLPKACYYNWSKEFLEAGKRRLAGDTARAATSRRSRICDRKPGR